MYFKDREDTNIDNEFENDNILSRIIKFVDKYKVIIIVALILVILAIIAILFFLNKEVTNYLVLNGEESITIYQGADYIEPGYDAYNSKNEDLNNQVVITSTLDVSMLGEYEITYTVGEITKTRKIVVVEKPKEYTFIYLNTVDNSINVYIKLGDKYEEPGYKVYSSTGKDLTSEVKVDGTVDTSKKGSYQLIYSVVDSNGVTVSESRTVIVMDTDISLSLSTNEYTNKDVIIDVGVVDNYFDYMLLPDGTKITDSSYSYKVSSNGKYTFKVYNKKGVVKEEIIEVKNIDRVGPTGSCTLDYNNNGSVITVNASDTSGIKKYVYDGKSYVSGNITLSSYIDSAKITIYDNAGNTKDISCKSVALPTITNISKEDKIIVKITAKKVSTDIAGYYFSYTNERPDKSTGGYLETSEDTIDVVRLVGTTYVWVEDKSGKISKPATITISEKDYSATWGGYSILNGTKLSDYLAKKNTSLEEFNKLMSRSVRAAGLGTKEGAATAAATLGGVLAYKYGIKVPYWRGGKTSSWGAYYYWGAYRENPTYEGYNYYGMDCDGLVNWAYKNGGNVYPSGSGYYHWRNDGLSVSKENGDIGDVMVTTGHVKIIIGKTDKEFIIAEAAGKASGIVISRHAYTNTSNYSIITGERIIKHYGKEKKSEIDSKFPAF